MPDDDLIALSEYERRAYRQLVDRLESEMDDAFAAGNDTEVDSAPHSRESA